MNKVLFKLIEGKWKFFLMRDVPEIEKDFYGDSWPHQTKKYVKALETCISEALKSGEIVNPQVLPVSFYHNSVLGIGRLSHNETNEPIDDGQTFDLPEGMVFEEDFIRMTPGIRLLPEKPVQKEESQEGLWDNDEPKDSWDEVLYICAEYDKTETSYYKTLDKLNALFTIRRKDS